MFPPSTLINFLSISCPAAAKTSATLPLFTEPNNLEPSPVLAVILTSSSLIAFATLVASFTSFSSLKARCFKVSANTFYAELVANTAYPKGIK